MRPRFTNLRKEILDLIQVSQKPLNAKYILENIASSPNVSTVYRALDFLVKMNLIQSVTFARIQFYFTYKDTEGGHFLFCGNCQDIQVFNDCIVSGLKEKVQKQFNYAILNHVLFFEGLCQTCQNQVH